MSFRSVRLLTTLLLLLLGITAPAFASSLEGLNLKEAQNADFFSWFHFTEYDRKPEPGQTTIVAYKTGVKDFDVQLAVITDKDGKIISMELVLPRKFVDDPSAGVFARDISKSFLQCALPDSDEKSMRSLIAEIEFGGQKLNVIKADKVSLDGGPTEKDKTFLSTGKVLKKGDSVWLETDGATKPSVPASNSTGYLTFLGKNEEYLQPLSDNYGLKISNKMFPDKLMMVVTKTH